MKAVILAGGMGTRLSEETHSIPKPMVEIGGKPILWHIMKIYSHYGINDFIICLGYMGYVVKEFFSNFILHNSDITFDLENQTVNIHNTSTEPWRVTLVDTGLESMTGGRLKKIRDYVGDDSFCMTYGDGLSDVDISEIIKFHNSHNALVSVTATPSPGRFGNLKIKNNKVHEFGEKVMSHSHMINGGFFVIDPKALDYVHDDMEAWETEPMERLVNDEQLMAYLHFGFWQPMDTLREKHMLESLWQSGNPPWKTW